MSQKKMSEFMIKLVKMFGYNTQMDQWELCGQKN